MPGPLVVLLFTTHQNKLVEYVEQKTVHSPTVKESQISEFFLQFKKKITKQISYKVYLTIHVTNKPHLLSSNIVGLLI